MNERLVVVALFEDVDLLDVTGPSEVFSIWTSYARSQYENLTGDIYG